MFARTRCVVLSTVMVVLGGTTPPLWAQQAAQDADTIKQLKAELAFRKERSSS